MNLKREFTGLLVYFVDLILPPIFRNSFIFSKIFKSKSFKDDIILQDKNVIKKYYLNNPIERDSDLTKKSTNLIIDFIKENNPKSICDIGGGNFFLKNRIYDELALKIDVVDFNYKEDNHNFIEHNLEDRFEFIKNNYYDLCISTHTIEHILNSTQFINEIRRISRIGFIMVFPKQFPYEHTPDLHINFYPFKFEVEKLVGKIDYKKNNLIDLKFDWVYTELKN